MDCNSKFLFNLHFSYVVKEYFHNTSKIKGVNTNKKLLLKQNETSGEYKA